MGAQVGTRPVTPVDEPFLYEVYKGTRTEEVTAWGWPPAQLEAFLRMQSQAQGSAYEWQFPAAQHRIILQDLRPIGRILVDRREQEIRLVDIALLPAWRGNGIGTSLIRQLQAEAAVSGKPLRLSVHSDNHSARRLYERLGFVATEENPVSVAMEWSPGA
jgi:ribosomal protein S18 acetylase RimI-like enzyme